MATILIVDDHPTNRELLVTLLGYAGHHLLSAVDGEEGLAAARARHPDLIITDIVMPKMDGYEFARQVRSDPAIGETQIIFYTSSYIVSETRHLAQACGVSIVIGKPIEPEQFLEAVQSALDSKETQPMLPVAEEFHSEHMRLLTDTLVKKVEELEAEIVEHKRAETHLAEAHEFLEKIMTSSPVGILTYKFTGECLSANEYGAHIVGATVNQLLSQNFRKLDSWKRSGLYKLAKKVIATRQQQTADIHLVTTFGKTAWFTTQFVVFHSGAEDCLLLTISDITERKQTEQALAESEAHYRQIIETAQEGVWAIDTDNRTTLANQRLADMLGYTIEEMIGKPIADFTDEEGKAIGEKSLENRRLGINEQLDFKYIRKDGGIVWAIIETSTLYDQNGQYVGALAMLTDITERKRAEQALQNEKDRAQQYLDIAGVMFLVLAADQKVILINKKGCEILGCPEDEIIGRNWFDHFIPEDKKDMTNAAFYKLMAGEVEPVEYFENPVLTKGGQERLIAWHNSNVTDEMGKIIGVVSSGEDITERRQAEERIRRQLARLTTLSEIDGTISSTLDLELGLTTVLVHVITQLEVDAADILLFDPTTQMLRFAVGQGFHSQAIENAPIPLSRGLAARAFLNRQMASISDLQQQPDDSPRSALFESEGFVSYFAVPLFAKGELNGVLGIFHRSRLQPDEEWLSFLNTLAGQCAIAIDNGTLFAGLQHSNSELALAYEATIEGWSGALDLRDKETEGHSQRVTDMTLQLAKTAGVSADELVHIRRGALLHDIGKMGVPDHILLKPDKLTDAEWKLMRMHPEFAYKLLAPIAYLQPALDIPYCHHEKWDGTGYPRGLKGEEIPLAARLFAVVDVWDALRSDRPYRAAWEKEKVRQHIKSLAGTHFDPQAVKIFLKIEKQFN